MDVNHTDYSFDRVIAFVQESESLKDLDLSWSSVRPVQMLKLLKVIEQNRTLANLSLSHNLLLED